MRYRSVCTTLGVTLFLLAGCGGGSSPAILAGPVPDFLLKDANPTSLTFNTDVSPRQMTGQISAWYFGTAT